MADPSAGASPSAVDPTTEALPILMASYPDFQALHYQTGDKLADLIARSNGGISLFAPDASAPTPIVTATLPGGVTYWRLASFTPKQNWAELGTELVNDSQHGTDSGAILDLRSNAAPHDIRGASQIINLFVPGDNSLKRYNLKDVDGNLLSDDLALNTHFHAPLVVLTNQQTSGAAEILAACLKSDGALVMGTQTAGKGATFTEKKLSDGEILRFVSEHFHATDGTDLWGHPIVPDISLLVDDEAEKGALVLIAHNDILDVIGESAERHLMSEAALVKGEDPEGDAYLASLEKKPVLLSLPVIHDETLIRALDSLKAIRVSQRWTESPTQAEAPPQPTSSVQ